MTTVQLDPMQLAAYVKPVLEACGPLLVERLEEVEELQAEKGYEDRYGRMEREAVTADLIRDVRKFATAARAYKELLEAIIDSDPVTVRGMRVDVEITRDVAGHGFVYFMRRELDGAIKIGFSADPFARLASIRAGSGPVTLLGYTPGGRQDEAALHRRFKHNRIGGEWFRLDNELLSLIQTCSVV